MTMTWNTVKEAAPKLEISTESVYALCASGRLRHRRIGPGGGKIRISDEAIEEYLRSCEVGGPGDDRQAAAGNASTSARMNKRKPVSARPDGKPFKYQW